MNVPGPAGAPRPAPRVLRMQQRGGMSVTMMLVMLGLVMMLGLVEIGFLYWAKRDAQKVADLAALAGAQRLELCAANQADNSAARGNAITANRFPGTVQVQCGNWNPANPAADHFTTTLGPQAPLNAVRVQAQRSVLPFFGQNTTLPTLQVQAVAMRAQPTAVFSVGSQLLRVNGNTPLGNVLRLVGVDLDRTTLLGYDGLAQAHITPGGLLQALGIEVAADIGIAEFNRLLAANRISLGQLLDATATVLAQSGVANVDLRALKDALATQINIDQANLQLGSNDAGSGLFARIVAPEGPASSALRADVNVMDLLTTGISIANGGRGVDVDNLSVLGLVNAKAAIIEPPSIAIGGVGTRAYNAQVRLNVDVDSNNLVGLGPIMSTLGVRLHLPIYADVTNAMGTLTALQCGAQPPTATINVESSVLRACVGRVDPANRFSTRNVCETTLENEQMLTLLGATLVNDKIRLNGLTHAESVTLAAGETASTRINAALLGDTVAALVNELLRVLGNVLNPAPKGLGTAETANRLAEQYLKAANPDPGKKYDVHATIDLLKNGAPARGIEPIGTWNIPKGVPYPCGLITCFRDGTVWEGYEAAVTGNGQGLLGGVLGTLLGGLVINRCNSLLTGLLAYNACVKGNLASYLQTAEEGVLDSFQGSGSVVDPSTDTVACSGLLCLGLKPVLDLLKPILNGVGTLLTQTLAQVLGLELGRTDVHLQSINCSPAQLVY